jgi:hypothetical protein
MAAVFRENEIATNHHQQRYNLYSSIHKALRGFMINTLAHVGQADVEDECEFVQAIEQVRGLMKACRDHLKHENNFVHPALERVAMESSRQTHEEHLGHVRAIAAVESRTDSLAVAPMDQRAFISHQLYLQLTAFVAENFEHMLVEETRNHEVLISGYTDAELLQIKDAIVASIPPEENLSMMRWMLEYMNNAEREAVLKDIKARAPTPAFQAVMDVARSALSQRDFFKLERILV